MVLVEAITPVMTKYCNGYGLPLMANWTRPPAMRIETVSVSASVSVVLYNTCA